MAVSTDQTQKSPARWLVVIVPYLWLALFFIAPFLIILKISLSDTAIAMPPYTPVFSGFAEIGTYLSQLDFENYIFLTEDPLYFDAYLNSLRIAAISTFLLLLIGYPVALAMARAPAGLRPTLLMLVILPFWTSFLIRVYAWIGILKPEGLLTLLLQSIGLYGPDDQVNIFRTDSAVFIGMVYSYLPFMILPLYAALEKMDGTLLEAASDLGCPPWKAFWKITFPLMLPVSITAVILRVIFKLKLADIVINMTAGGPGGATDTVTSFIFREYRERSNVGYGTMLAFVYLVLIILFVTGLLKLASRWNTSGHD